jgi:hypothetical protein
LFLRCIAKNVKIAKITIIVLKINGTGTLITDQGLKFKTFGEMLSVCQSHSNLVNISGKN